MEQGQIELTELQFRILDGIADDYEDVEQLYLFVNRDFAAESELGVRFSRNVIEVRFSLRELMDEIANMLDEEFIEAKHSSDEKVAPLNAFNLKLLHHYWFGPTEKGHRAWSSYRMALQASNAKAGPSLRSG